MMFRGLLVVGVFIFSLVLAGCEVTEVLIPDPQLDWTVKLGVPALCKKLGGETEEKEQSRQDRCLAQMAENKGKTEICDQIKSESKRQACKQQSGLEPTGTVVNCDQGDQATTNDCLMREAVAKKDIAGCEAIGDENAKADCQAWVAKETNNDLWCEKITVPRAKENCYYDMAIGRNDAKFCVSLSDNYRKGSCLRTVAKALGDVDLCQSIDAGELRTPCMYELALEKQDLKGCILIGPQDPQYVEC